MIEPTESPEARAARIEEAKRAHEDVAKSSLAMLPAVISFATEALKSAALINGGSVAAMLAFIGTGRQPVTADTIWALKLFGFGLVAATVATGGSYLAQLAYHADVQFRVGAYEPPFIRYPRKSRIAGTVGVVLHVASVLLVAGAYACAIVALFTIAGTLVPMQAKT